jgi:hypothetical protein
MGKFDGSTGGGSTLVNIDERETFYQGIAYTHPNNPALPSSAAFFRTKDKDLKGELRTDALLPLDPLTKNVTSWEAVKDKYAKDIIFSKYADVTISCDSATLTLSWKESASYLAQRPESHQN